MRIIFFQDSKGEWRCRVVAKNGKTLLVSSESYRRKANLEKMILSVIDEFGHFQIPIEVEK